MNMGDPISPEDYEECPNCFAVAFISSSCFKMEPRDAFALISSLKRLFCSSICVLGAGVSDPFTGQRFGADSLEAR